ncbi:MAG: nucleotidyltransferase domain-containing protein [Chloroflexi bacterium]|nr:nucleotidyltransferase domain-containing protein [Chloroflexota bacterium]MCL5275519.1 nucleotidyltransferase domain-containing protein [Chloroflexota bacterium]
MPTALQLSTAERQTYTEAIRRRMALLDRPLSTDESLARDKLLERIRLVAKEIKARLGARRVILFGSLAHQAWFRQDSDVDIAVDGLPDTAYWQAWKIAEQIIPEKSIDLIDIDTASTSLKQAIERHGIEL